jgi:hypothetical protein
VATVTVMSDRDSRLPPRAEALLSSFSIPERDFEAMEERVRAQVAQTTIGSTPAALLEAPLPAEPGEEAGAAPPSSPTTRLSDLARAVAHKKVDAAADAEIARETLSVASKLRSQTDVLLERMRAAPRAAEPPLRPRATAAPNDDAALPAAPVRLPPPPFAPASDRPPAPAPAVSKGSRRFAWIGGAGLSLAAAAALIVLVRQPGDVQEAVSVAAVQAPSEAKSGPAAPAASQTPTPAATATPEPAAAPAVAETSAVTKEPVADDSAVVGRTVVAARPMSGRAAAPAKRTAGGEKVVLEETPPAAARKPGQEPAKTAAENELKPAAGKTDGLLPDKPSTGAVQAAIASVMNSARACVAGADAPTPATVMFGSNGAVKSVVVSGAAQGSPAGKCIQSALGRAKVAPFAQNVFSVGVSVRP